MIARRQRLRSTRGFTLLELLLATAIASIVLIAINTTFFSALRLHNTTHAKIDQDLAVQRALGIVRRDLAGIMLPTANPNNTLVLAGPLQNSDMRGTPGDPTGERVSPDIYTNSGKVDGWNPFSEVQMVSYFLSPANDGTTTKNLVRAVTRNVLSSDEQGPEDQQVILSRVASAEVLFYDGIDWVSDWDSVSTSTLPTAIKFRFSLVRAGTESALVPEPAGPMEMIVPVLVTTTASAQQAAADAAAAP
jgi:general secretion pathway protein J